MDRNVPDELPKKRWWIKLLVVLAALCALSAGGWVIYRNWQVERLSQRARIHLEGRDFRNALLNAHLAISFDPKSEAAARVMAEITDEMQVPQALYWRQRMVELTPGSAPEAFAWVATAMRMGKTELAQQALAAIPESERGSARYHSTAGMLALSTGKIAEAKESFASALKLAPENELHQYNHAALLLQSRDPAERAAGVETLDRLTQGKQVQTFARRSLVTRFSIEKRFDEALVQSAALQNEPDVLITDRLAFLDLLRQLHKTEYPSALAEVQKRASSTPEDAAALITWMRPNMTAAEAATWAESLDAAVQATPRVNAVYAECLADAQRWEDLRARTEKPGWGDFEFIRLAFQSRALRELGNGARSALRWSEAITASGQAREKISRLVYLSSSWGWKIETQKTLWAAAEMPLGSWALQLLNQSYAVEGNTSGLLRVAKAHVKADPKNDAARNNVAMLSLLLRRETAEALKTARELHEHAPANAAYASTYAFALHEHERTAEGLEVLRKLPAEQLSKPALAAYYGILLAASGARSEAEPYLTAAKHASLLPEESQLLARYLR